MRLSKAMDDLIRVRVASEEKRHLLETARKRGMTLSELLRELAAEAVDRVAA